MTVKEKVEGFLKSVESISVGHNEIIFFEADYVQDGQVGYGITPDGQSLVTGKRGDWKEEWLAIGYEELTDDPIFVNMNTAALKVSSAQREEGAWEPYYIADSLDNLKNIIDLLQTIAKGRTTPNELEENPINEEERKAALAEIQKQNPNSKLWYWENFLENI